MVRILLVLIDGLGDASYAALGDRTPLESAHRPHMNSVAARGVNGLLDPVEPGLACGSDTAHLSIFGYDPRVYYRGRGAFESLGAGLEMEPGDIAFKCNFATMDAGTRVVTSRRADRDFEVEGTELCSHLDGMDVDGFEGYQVRVQYATEHRCGVVIRGPGMSARISGTDPLRDGLPLAHCMPTDDSVEAAFTSRLVNQLSREISQRLECHPINATRRRMGQQVANVVLFRGCGDLMRCQSFLGRYGLRGFMVAPTCIIAGLGKSLGMEIIRAPGATGGYRSDFRSKARTAVETLMEGGYDFGFLHIKAVDDAGHDRDPVLKRRLIEEIDMAVGDIVQRVGGESVVLCITSDHSTVCTLGDHSSEPVPFTVCRYPAGPCDSVREFGETLAGQGSLGRFSGAWVMEVLMGMREGNASEDGTFNARARGAGLEQGLDTHE